jgi:hypothetical protein
MVKTNLARRHTVATDASLAEVLGVSRPDSVPNLARRIAPWMTERDQVRGRHDLLEEQLRADLSCEKTANPVWPLVFPECKSFRAITLRPALRLPV